MNQSSAAFVYEFGEFRVDPRTRVLSRSGGVPVEITSKAFDTLLYFLDHAGTAVSRTELLEALWPDTIVEANSLHRVIMALRRALDDGQEGRRFIATLQGRGYQFVATVRKMGPAPEAPGPDAAAAVPILPVDPPARSVRGRRPLPGIILTATALLVVASIAAWLTREPPDAGALPNVTRTSMVTSYPGTELGPSLSPDGTRVAFSWDGADGNRDLYIAQVSGGAAPQRLTEAPEPDRDPAWSPDASQIAFLRQRARDQFDIYVISVLDRTERRIDSIRFDVRFAAPMLAWTADGRSLIYPTIASGERTSRIHALSLDTGRSIQLTTRDDATDDSSPAISSDGQWLLFKREPLDDAQPSRMMLQRLAGLAPVGPPTALPTERARLAHSPAWSPDSLSVAYVEERDIVEWRIGDPQVRVVYSSQLLGGTTAGFETSAMSLLRGPTRTLAVVAGVSMSADIWALPLDPGTRTATGAAVRRFVSTVGDVHAQHSPDGQRVAFISNRNGSQQVWLAPADDSSESMMLTRLDVRVSLLSWSPDGRRLAFNSARPTTGDRILYVVGTDDGVPLQLPVAGVSPIWSNDGESLYFTDLESESILRFRIGDERPELLFPGGFTALSTDGQSLLYSKFGEPGVFRRSLVGNPADNPELRLVPDHTLGRGGVAPVSDGFFYTASNLEGIPYAIRFFDYATAESRDVAPTPSAMVEKLSVSPDGSELLYSAQSNEAGSDLVLLEFE